MSSANTIELEGTIVAVLPGTMFRVELDNQHQVLAHISGKMRKNFVRLTYGDRVKLEMSPHDLTKARILYRIDRVHSSPSPTLQSTKGPTKKSSSKHS